MQRVFRNVERYVNFIGQTLIQSAKQRTATCQIDTVVHNVGIQFGWCILQCAQDRSLNLGNRFLQAMRHLLIAYGYLHRKCRNTIRTMNNIIFGSIFTQFGQCRTDINLDTFCHTFADLYIMLTAHVFLNISSQIITGNADRVIGNYTPQ